MGQALERKPEAAAQDIPRFLALIGILLPVLLILMLRLANNRRLLGNRVNSPLINILAWATTIMLIVLTVMLTVSSFLP